MEKRLSSENIAKFPNLILPEEVDSDNSEIANGFKERVKTFVSNRNWTSHQMWLYPTVCAQYGWKCVTDQLLRCETCYANLSPAIPNLNNIALHETYIKDTLDKLKTAHQKHCPWPHTPCPDRFIRIYSVHKEEAYQTFIKRFKSLYSLREQLPQIKKEAIEKIGLSKDLCSSLCNISFVTQNNFSTSAVILAATGWTKDFETKLKNKLICQSCQRSIPLLLYISVSSVINEVEDGSILKESPTPQTVNNEDIPTENNDTSSDTSLQKGNLSSPKLKKRKTSMLSPEPFDPLYEHRSWCPWLIDGVENIESTADSATEDLKNILGWQLFIKCLLRNIKCTNKSSNIQHESLKNQLRRARDMVESWNSPCVK